MPIFKLENEFNKISIDTIGGQLIDFQTLDKNNIWQKVFYIGQSTKRTGIPVLFPFADPLENDIFNFSKKTIPRHGFARNSQFQAPIITKNKIEITLDYNDLSAEFQTAYPFKFSLTLIFDISKKGNLILEMQVKNLENILELPISPGLHPYFPCVEQNKNQLKLALQSKDLKQNIKSHNSPDLFFEQNKNNLPENNPDKNQTNQSGFTTIYKEIQINQESLIDLDLSATKDGDYIDFDSKNNYAKLILPELFTVKITDTLGVCENLVFWHQNSLDSTIENPILDYDFVCLEPFCKKANAINTDPIIVKPGQTWKWQITFKTTF